MAHVLGVYERVYTLYIIRCIYCIRTPQAQRTLSPAVRRASARAQAAHEVLASRSGVVKLLQLLRSPSKRACCKQIQGLDSVRMKMWE